MYRVQVFHPESGFFLNTTHESEDLDGLRSLLDSSTFDGFKCRIIDTADNEVRWDQAVRERRAGPTVDDMARMLGVPMIRRIEDLGLGEAGQDDMPT